MNAFTIALSSGAALWLGYRFYGRFIFRRVYDAGGLPDEFMPSRERSDGVDFVPTRRSVLLGHHYVTIAGAGPIVGPAVAVTWGWLPALLWVVLGAIFIGAVHDLGALVASVRNRGRTIGDLAADIMTPRVRTLFLAFIALALWVVLAVFAWVIADLFVSRPQSLLAIWIEVPLAMCVATMVYRRGGSMLRWSLLALVAMYAAIAVGTLPAVSELLDGGSHIFWLCVLFAYSYGASVLPVTKLLQPRDYINSHQLFLALGILLTGLFVSGIGGGTAVDLVAPAVNRLPADHAAPSLYPFLFITIACGAISGFHCMVASGTTSRQLESERDARAIGYGSMILEGALAVVVILCCVSAAGFESTAAWDAKYTLAFAGQGSLLAKLQGFIQGGAGYMHTVVPFLGVEFLRTVIAVVIISFAATTMDSATRIQRYVITELGNAAGARVFARKHVATSLAVLSAAALAIFAKSGGKGGLVLWPVFGVMNQLLACMTFLILNTWLAKRGKPVIYTLIPMLFLLVTVTWAGVSKVTAYLSAPVENLHLIVALGTGLVLEAWMIWEGISVFRLSRHIRRELARNRLSRAEAQARLAGPTGAVIGIDGAIRGGEQPATFPEGTVC